MTSRDFCFWLNGLFELSDVDKNKANDSLSIEQVKCIKEHLALVFRRETSPPTPAFPSTGGAGASQPGYGGALTGPSGGIAVC